jgi:hypothetical protein
MRPVGLGDPYDIMLWSVDEVRHHLVSLGMEWERTVKIKEQHVNGEVLLALEPDDFKELGIPMGIAKLHSKWRNGTLGLSGSSLSASNSSASLSSSAGSLHSVSPAPVSPGPAKEASPAAVSQAAQQNPDWPAFPGIALLERVATSGQGDVYRGVHLTMSLSTEVAVKVLHEAKGDLKAFAAEVQTLQALHHVNILKWRTFFDQPRLCVVTRWMEKGSLSDALKAKRKQGLTMDWEAQGRRYAGHIACGLAYLHGQQVVHRDVKSANVLIGGDDVAVLADFGLAHSVDSHALQAAVEVRAGTLQWMAPEMFVHGVCSAASDVYAFGIVLWEMCSCRVPYDYPPYASVAELRAAVVRGERPKVDGAWHAEPRELMARCWGGSGRPAAAFVAQVLCDDEMKRFVEATRGRAASLAKIRLFCQKVDRDWAVECGLRSEVGDNVRWEDLFAEHSLVFIEGEAGMGKSTVLKRMAARWASGPELAAWEADFVFFVPLSALPKDNFAAVSLKMLLMAALDRNEELAELGVKVLGKNSKHSVVWLFDGLDEVVERRESGDCAVEFVRKLATREGVSWFLPSWRCVVSSRQIFPA